MRSVHHLSISARHGMTLLEIMIVVMIISLLAAIALPAMAKARRASQNARFISDMRVAMMAFEQASFQPTGFPPDAAPGVVPDNMDTYLSNMKWTEETPIGGNWDWNPDVADVGRAVTVVMSPLDDSRMAEIDKVMDDGDLATGEFRKLQDGTGYSYHVE